MSDAPSKARIRVLVHALRLAEGPRRQKAGNFSHTLHLLCALQAQPGLELSVLCDDDSFRELSGRMDPSRLVRTSTARGGVLRADWEVVRAIARMRPDVYHRPTGQLPFLPVRCPAVSTIADLNFLTLPMPVLKRWYKHLSYRRTVRRADRITCISEYTRRELFRFHAVDPSRVCVIHHGAPKLPDPVDTVRARAGLEYWVTFGHQAHKNVEVCLAALQRRPSAERLAVVGWCAHVDDVLKPMAHRLGLAGRVDFLGRISDAELHGLYRGALGLLFLSRYEGFGLPVLEAMNSGCAVVSSNVCSLPEVVGDAGVLVDPDDVEAVLAGMERLRGAEGKGWRAAGQAWASRFTWDEAARRTAAVYAEIAGTDR